MMAALHFARSYAYKERHEDLASEQRARLIESLPHGPSVVQMWEEEYGVPPTAESVAEVLDENWAEKIGPNSAFAMMQMTSYYNQALDHLGPLHVQAAVPTGRAEFLLGDCALVIARADGSKIGGRFLALKDADRLLLPIAPRLAVLFTSSDEGDQLVDDAAVQSINRFTWDAAGRQALAHPDTDLGWSLMATSWLPKVKRNEPCLCGSGLKSKRCHPR